MKNNNKFRLDVWGFITLAMIAPVSYTHLDVYKRQVLLFWMMVCFLPVNPR